jgi:hypothetical protein
MSYMDEILNEREKIDFQEHLICCEACRREFQMWMEIQQGIEEIEMLAPGDDFEQKVMGSIDLSLYSREAKSSRLWKQVFLCAGIYIFILVGMHWSMDGFNHSSRDLVLLFQNFITLGSFVEKISFRYFVLLLTPQNFFYTLFQQLSSTGLLVYGAGLLNLILLFIMMQLTLFKILKEKREKVR